MRSPRPGVVLATAALLLTTASAQQPVPPPAFRFERPVNPGGPGPRRLAIDVTMLVGGAPWTVSGRQNPNGGETAWFALGGLSDLRLADVAGREIGYLFAEKPRAEPTWKPSSTLPIPPVDTEKEKTTGFEADLGDAYPIDRLRIDALPPPFLKRVRLEGSGDRARWTVLVAEGTVFDLPDERLRQIELAFVPGSFRYLRVTWDDTHSARAASSPVVAARLAATAVRPPPLTAAVVVERRPSEPGHSRYRLRLPGGRLPIVALDFDIGGGHVLRQVGVYEARLAEYEAAPVMIGSGTLRRVVRESLTASALRIAIGPPSEAQLDLVVDDGDNPPLDLRGVNAVFADLPWIYFESDGGALTARYGNASLAAPRYDLEAVREKLDVGSVPDAAWGDARARLAEENAAAAPPLPTVGASLDAALFTYVRAIPVGEAGLIALPLDAAVLAHSAGAPARFADVRVVDGAGRQVPYLVERASEPLSLDLRLERLSSPPKAFQQRRPAPSVYRVSWPFERLPSPRLVLTTSARVFRRSIAVGIDREADRRHRDAWIETLATVAWTHADQDRPTPALMVPLPTADAKELLLIVEEGDNTPLPLEPPRVLLPAYRLRFFRERGAALRLAYGRSDLAPPRYDLALLAPQVLGVAATEIAAGEEQPARGAAATAALVSPRLFWAVLAVAVVALLALIVRLAKKEN